MRLKTLQHSSRKSQYHFFDSMDERKIFAYLEHDSRATISRCHILMLIQQPPVTSATLWRIDNNSTSDRTSKSHSPASRDLASSQFSFQHKEQLALLYSILDSSSSRSTVCSASLIQSGPYTDDLRDLSRVCRDLASLRCAAFQRQT
jgi:hypothetical protein